MKLNKTLLVLAISTLLLSACSDTDEKDASLTDGSQNASVVSMMLRPVV